MRENVFKEYKLTIHYSNTTGVRATCPDCHVPREWAHKLTRKIRATNDLFHWAVRSIDTKEKFEAKRHSLARQVWAMMKSNNSQECRNYHDIDSMKTSEQTEKPRPFHELTVVWKMTCIDCHKGIAHKLPKEFDKEITMDQLHDRLEKEKVNCESCHLNMARPKSNNGWD
ncbi:MAG TPA: Denitrification system component NirT [Rhodospirillales bacterium]|jgi:cytochrome c-type protein NapC|nr:Denitrification system component NirT [Rhodospirillales bacterium]